MTLRTALARWRAARRAYRIAGPGQRRKAMKALQAALADVLKARGA